MFAYELPDVRLNTAPITCLEGFENTAGSLPSIKEAMRFILQLIYADEHPIDKVELPTWEKRERNAEIYRRYLAGEDSMVLARLYGLSDRRIRNIIEKERKKGNRSNNTSSKL